MRGRNYLFGEENQMPLTHEIMYIEAHSYWVTNSLRRWQGLILKKTRKTFNYNSSLIRVVLFFIFFWDPMHKLEVFDGINDKMCSRIGSGNSDNRYILFFIRLKTSSTEKNVLAFLLVNTFVGVILHFCCWQDWHYIKYKQNKWVN